MGQPRYDSATNSYVYGPGPDDDTIYTADGAIAHKDGVHAIAKTSAAAMTLAVPTAAEEGMRITLVGRTAFAHKVTVTTGLGGVAARLVITFALVGDSVVLLADNLKWVAEGAPYGATIAAT